MLDCLMSAVPTPTSHWQPKRTAGPGDPEQINQWQGDDFRRGPEVRQLQMLVSTMGVRP